MIICFIFDSITFRHGAAAKNSASHADRDDDILDNDLDEDVGPRQVGLGRGQATELGSADRIEVGSKIELL